LAKHLWSQNTAWISPVDVDGLDCAFYCSELTAYSNEDH